MLSHDSNRIDLMLPYIFLVAGFIILLKGADLLVDGASSIAARMKISPLVIGLTVVAFGTSAPELFVNVYASLKGSTDIAIGNVLGSNIANIFLILGCAAIIYPLTIHHNTTWKEIPFSLLAAVVLGVMANDFLIDHDGQSILTRSDGIILLCFFGIFMYYVVEVAKETGGMSHDEIPLMSGMKSTLFIFLGLAGLVLGGQWIVNGAVSIAKQFNVSESFIGLTIVAIGTSLPELATSIIAARKKNIDIAVGNVVGSNIFNIFLILGISATIKPLPFQAANLPDVMVTLLASALLFGFIFLGQRHILQRWQGIMFVTLYAIYLLYVGIRG